MADSVDRVFGHALNTINKIQTGSRKPPVVDRLRLYGLYKQAMEGDVSDIQDRPSGDTETTRREREKWDAWDFNAGLSRTAAKRSYIETLIRTMHTYANEAPESRALVSELEFVWDQIKDNSLPSSDSADRTDKRRSIPLPSIDGDQDAEEFVDAPISQVDDAEKVRPAHTRRASFTEVKWRKRVEASLVKMTAQVAAMREQLESRQYGRMTTRKWRYIARFAWFLAKVIAADVFVLFLVMLYMRHRKDSLKGAIQVLMGDAQAMALNIAAQIGTKLVRT